MIATSECKIRTGRLPLSNVNIDSYTYECTPTEPAKVDTLLYIDKSVMSRLKITVGHRVMSDQNQKLSDQTKNTTDILSDEEKFEAKLNVQPDYASVRP